MSYKVCKFVSFPSSGGTGPENWFASSILIGDKTNQEVRKDDKPHTTTITPSKYTSFLRISINMIISRTDMNELNPKLGTYRYVREVKFPRCLGISPDKRFTRRELQTVVCNM